MRRALCPSLVTAVSCAAMAVLRALIILVALLVVANGEEKLKELPVGLPVYIAAGGDFTCAILETGPVLCWGSGLFGELGHGNTSNIGDGVAWEMPPAPISLMDNTTVPYFALLLECGEEHACVILETGDMKCWGSSQYGQTGYETSRNFGDAAGTMPPPAVDFGLHTPADVSAGRRYTCAVLVDGTVRCWGFGGSGQLGNGDRDNFGDRPGSMPPPQVKLPGTVRKVSSGESFNCALLQSGHISCWGANEFGQLGQMNTVNIGDYPHQMPPPLVPLGQGADPFDYSAIDIECGYQFACALFGDGSVQCWGRGEFGALGQGSQENIGHSPGTMPPPFVPLGLPVTQLKAGNQHVCAVTLDNRVLCWGSGESGQLGNGIRANVGNAPGQMPPEPLVFHHDPVEVALGREHTCVLLVTGAVHCWGSNSEGQLGYDSKTSLSTPGPAVTLDASCRARRPPMAEAVCKEKYFHVDVTRMTNETIHLNTSLLLVNGDLVLPTDSLFRMAIGNFSYGSVEVSGCLTIENASQIEVNVTRFMRNKERFSIVNTSCSEGLWSEVSIIQEYLYNDCQELTASFEQTNSGNIVLVLVAKKSKGKNCPNGGNTDYALVIVVLLLLGIALALLAVAIWRYKHVHSEMWKPTASLPNSPKASMTVAGGKMSVNKLKLPANNQSSTVPLVPPPHTFSDLSTSPHDIEMAEVVSGDYNAIQPESPKSKRSSTSKSTSSKSSSASSN